MEKTPEVIIETILPSGRGLRFVPIDTSRLLEITERASSGLSPADVQNPIKLQLEISKETVATCVRGITARPLTLEYKPVPPAKEGEAPVRVPDMEKTLLKYRDPEKRAWRALGYQQLVTDGPDHMLTVFSNPADWNAVAKRINGASGGGPGTIDPFAGQSLTLTTGL